MDKMPRAQRFYFHNGRLIKGMQIVESRAQSGSEGVR